MGSLRRILRKPAAKRVGQARHAKPQTEFVSFFESVFGRLNSTDAAMAATEVNRLAKGLGRKDISLEEIRRTWGKIAAFAPKIFDATRLDSELLQLRRHANLNPGDSIASIGSGLGVMEAFIAKRIVPRGFVACVDISPEMNRLAARAKEIAGAKNMSILTASGTEIKLPSNSQDKVIIGQTDLIETMHWKPVLKEAMRIMKKSPASRLIVSFSLDNRSQIKIVDDSLRAAGFEPVLIMKYGQKGNSEAIMIFSELPFGAWAKSAKK